MTRAVLRHYLLCWQQGCRSGKAESSCFKLEAEV